jgi:serine/threonine protein kinase
LHEEAAKGDELDELTTAEESLEAARGKLHASRRAARDKVVEMVCHASKYFPELRHISEDVRKFMDSDGLQATHRELSDYDIICVLPTTSRNEVYRARRGGVEVCLKGFRLQADMRNYIREIQNVQKLQHKFIIRYTAVFEDKHTMYVQMQYFKYGSLRRWTEESDPDASQKQTVLRQILMAIACMHESKIVHRDIKNDNVLIADDHTPRICDFEMSTDVGASMASTMVHAGGTLGFIAPEVQSLGTSYESDMYSFGVLMLNTLHPPAAGQQYPQLNTSALTDLQAKTCVEALMDKTREHRPTAPQLQTETYFADRWECVICFEEFGGEEGIRCKPTDGVTPHFVCKECLSNDIVLRQAGNITFDGLGGDYVRCCDGECTAPAFPIDVVAKHCRPDAFAAITTRVDGIKTQQMELDFDQKRKDLEAELLKMSKLQLEILGARNHITEEIMTLRCPKCRNAFVDYSGCAALTCSSCRESQSVNFQQRISHFDRAYN